jgi:hypothetical protein
VVIPSRRRIPRLMELIIPAAAGSPPTRTTCCPRAARRLAEIVTEPAA